jgi:hypothetical protein
MKHNQATRSNTCTDTTSTAAKESGGTTSAPAKYLRQVSICPCALNCGDTSKGGSGGLTKLPACEHEMHADCLEGLLNTRGSSCPMCRSSIESLRTSKHFTNIDKEIEDSWQQDLARAIAMSEAAAKAEEEELARVLALSAAETSKE